jgi:hypothetical protein
VQLELVLVAVYVPRSQSSQASARVPLEVPGGHTSHFDARPTLNVPEEQSLHVVAPSSAAKLDWKLPTLKPGPQ